MVGSLHTVTTTTDYTTTSFVDDDYFIVNSGGDYSADISKKAGADCNVNSGGIYRVDPGVSALFNNGVGGWDLNINENGQCYIIGTDGNNAVIGGDAGTDGGQIFSVSGGYIYAKFATIEYIHIYLQTASTTYLIDTTIGNLPNAANALYTLRINLLYMERVEYEADAALQRCIYIAGGGVFYLKDCIFRASTTGEWNFGNTGGMVYIVGSNTFTPQGGATVPIDDTNDSGTWVSDYRFYPKLTIDESNNLTDCEVTINHDSMTADGQFIHPDLLIPFEPYLVHERTDGSGDVDIYLLQKTFWKDTYKYWSDSGQTEAGDNQKFTIGLIKDGYNYKTTTAWADDGTASITLAPKGRNPRERRHGV